MGEGTVYDLQGRTGTTTQQLRRLWALHERLARGFGATLAGLLRTAVDVSVNSVDQISYGQFVRDTATPACFYVLSADPWDDRLMLDVEASILHPMIDLLLGGAAEDGTQPNRPLTEIESCLAARIVRVFLQECRSAWQKLVELKLDVLQVESNPRLLRILPADEPVILVTFQVSLGQLRGAIRLCLPCRPIERIGERLQAEDPIPINRPGSGSLAAVNVALAETQIGANELADLRPGDIIVTETAADNPAIVSVDGIAKFRAKPGTFRGRKAVRLTEELGEAKVDC
jgi:flagellar motor switch protein FliM